MNTHLELFTMQKRETSKGYDLFRKLLVFWATPGEVFDSLNQHPTHCTGQFEALKYAF